MVIFYSLLPLVVNSSVALTQKLLNQLTQNLVHPRIFRGEGFIDVLGLSWNCHCRAVIYLFTSIVAFSLLHVYVMQLCYC